MDLTPWLARRPEFSSRLLQRIVILFAAYQAKAVLAPVTAGIFLMAVLWPAQNWLRQRIPAPNRARDHHSGNERRRPGFRLANCLGPRGPIGYR